VRRITKTALTLAATIGMVAALAELAAPALATYKPPVFRLACGAAATGGTLQGSVCVLPFGTTTAPNSYSSTITAVAGGATTTFTVASGSLPPGLTLPAEPGSGTDVITGTPTKAGVYDFTIKATTTPSGGKTVTLAYEITITVQGAPDQLVCTPASNGGFLESGVCVLPDAVTGLAYAGHLLTSHQAGGALSVVSGSLPAGLLDPGGPERATGHQRKRRISLHGDSRPGVCAELLPQRRCRAVHLVRCLRFPAARPHLADLCRPTRRQR
jgi:hypothetical protein